jgi:2,3-dihydroxybenzoate-AMP ligase
MSTKDPAFDGLQKWPDTLERRYIDEGIWGTSNFACWIDALLSERNDTIVLSGPGFPTSCWQDLSGQELLNLARRLAKGLSDLGLIRGDRVVMQMNNGNAFVITLFALFELGVIPVMALPGHGRREIEHFIKLTSARAWLASENDSGTDLLELGARLLDAIPALKHVILDLDDAGSHRTLSSCLSDEQVVYSRISTEFGGHLVDPASIALLLCSGGTTGLPKLIPRTHRDYLYNATESAKVCELDDSDAYLVALPAAHNFPLACPGILGALSAGARIVMCSSPSPDIAFDCIERTGATVTALVPPLVRVWLEHSAAPESLRLLQVGGARLDASIARRVPKELGCSLQQVFGMAEGLLNFTRASDPDVVVNSTQGRPLSDHDEIRIVDADGADVPAGKRGELWTRGPYTLRGYYKDDEANRRSFTEDGFYRSGDLVRQLSTGHLVVEGRIKEVIRRGAETVSVETLESILASHPAIKDAAVIGLPCEQHGEQVCAVLVLSEPAASNPTLIELRHFLLEEGIARFMLPDSIEFIDQIPLTAVGKIARQQLVKKIQTQKSSETEGVML